MRSKPSRHGRRGGIKSTYRALHASGQPSTCSHSELAASSLGNSARRITRGCRHSTDRWSVQRRGRFIRRTQASRGSDEEPDIPDEHPAPDEGEEQAEPDAIARVFSDESMPLSSSEQQAAEPSSEEEDALQDGNASSSSDNKGATPAKRRPPRLGKQQPTHLQEPQEWGAMTADALERVREGLGPSPERPSTLDEEEYAAYEAAKAKRRRQEALAAANLDIDDVEIGDPERFIHELAQPRTMGPTYNVGVRHARCEASVPVCKCNGMASGNVTCGSHVMFALSAYSQR